MSKKKLTKKELLARQAIDDLKFKRTFFTFFGSMFVFIILYLVFHVFWHDTRFVYRQFALYGKVIPTELVCMNGDKLLIHKSIKLNYKGNDFFFCNRICYEHFINHYEEDAFIPDLISSSLINKSTALIGLKERGKPELIYFKNKNDFLKYYLTKQSK